MTYQERLAAIGLEADTELGEARAEATRLSILSSGLQADNDALRAEIERLKNATALPLVPAYSSQMLATGYGVCAHPTFLTTTYQHADAWVGRLAGMGVTYFRGLLNPDSRGVQATLVAARKYGVKWLMTVAPEDGADAAETVRRVNWIADNAADVCIGIEGINEPNHNRDGTPVAADWPQKAVAIQKVLFQAVRARRELDHAPVVGPSLHNVVVARNDGRDYVLLRDAGILPYQDVCGLHHYAGGNVPQNGLAIRLKYVFDAYGANYPIWVTETGYTNAVNTTGGHKPVPTNVSAIYGPRIVVELGAMGLNPTRYEALDDPDAAKADTESNFGLWAVGGMDPSTWVAKPEVGTVRTLLALLKDDGAPYRPAPVRLKVEGPADVKVYPAVKRDGSGYLLVYRALSVYDPVAKTAIGVPEVDVRLTDSTGTRTVKVGPSVQAVPLRP